MWDKDLLPKQREAAGYRGTHARLLAGPGTGKTRVLSSRIEYLIEELHVDPQAILALTFTRAATFELRDRVRKNIGEGNIPKISTLHSFALTQLLKNQRIVDELPKPLRIADDWEEKNIIFKDIKKVLGLSKTKEVNDLFNAMSSNWESLENIDTYSNIENPRFIGAWTEHRKIFGYTMRSELVYQLKRSLEYYSDFKLDPNIEYLIIDEYQDLNQCDLSIIKSLKDKGVEVFVAGDDDQSIYGFRNANPEGIRNFHTEFENTKDLALDTCIRCAPQILTFADFIAEQDTRRIKKNIKPLKTDPEGSVHLLEYPGQDEESFGIATICKDLIENHSIKPDEILVLARSNRYNIFSCLLEQDFSKLGIPFSSLSVEESPFDTKIGREILSILRLLRNPTDNLAWRSILELRNNNVGEVKIDYLTNHAISKNFTFYEALVDILKDIEIDSKIRKPIEADYQNIIKLLDELSHSLEENIGSGNSILAWLNIFINEYSSDNAFTIDVINYLQRFGDPNKMISLQDLLHAIEASDNEIEQEIEKGKVNFLTMHKAKGLSAKAVFILACEQEYIPGDNKIDDERRLLYVSLTRAKEYLFLTYCDNRSGRQKYSGSNQGSPSRHLSEFIFHSPLKKEDGLTFKL